MAPTEPALLSGNNANSVHGHKQMFTGSLLVSHTPAYAHTRTDLCDLCVYYTRRGPCE